MLPLEEAGGLRVGPSTWAWLHSPCRSHISASSSGPESRDLTRAPKLGETCLELCPFALPEMWECTREGPGKAVLAFRKDSFSGGWGLLGAISKQAEEVVWSGRIRGLWLPPCRPMSRAFSRLFLSLFSEKL